MFQSATRPTKLRTEWPKLNVITSIPKMVALIDFAEVPAERYYRVKWDNGNETWEQESNVDILLLSEFHKANPFGKQKFIIKAVLAMALREKKVLVEWEGQNIQSWSWEPLQNLEEDAPDAISFFIEGIKNMEEEQPCNFVYTKNDVIVWGIYGRNIIEIACKDLEASY
ncbi:hypothetical protein EYR41_006095 [Orbilia oligospora]|uniref:Chromo domain-containing protein n=1 Tax=Orbilia oligospora TaxID=2813651 RepID=A0A8H2HKP4_ORBOL|nr:hypothetical protein EYR41_006095 [Orbilia oligospora]